MTPIQQQLAALAGWHRQEASVTLGKNVKHWHREQAAHIVRVVDAHDKLAAALRDTRRLFGSAMTQEWRDHMDAVLAEVETVPIAAAPQPESKPQGEPQGERVLLMRDPEGSPLWWQSTLDSPPAQRLGFAYRYATLDSEEA